MFLDICKNLDFPAEAVEVLVQGLDQIRTDAAAVQDLQKAVDSLMTPECDEYLQLMQRISDQTGVHRYVVDMVVLLLAVEPLKVRYEQRGLPEQLMWDSMADLRYKLIECKDVYNIWGTFVTPWFKWFYTCNRFKLGRLEFASLVGEIHSPEEAPEVYTRLANEKAFPVVQFDWGNLS